MMGKRERAWITGALLSSGLLACGGGGGGSGGSSVDRQNPAPTIESLSVSEAQTWPGHPVTFTANKCETTGTRHYRWDFGDGSTEGQTALFDKPVVTHTYAASSTAPLVVTVLCIDDAGRSKEAQLIVSVGPEALATVAGQTCSGQNTGQGWCRQRPRSLTPAMVSAAALTRFKQWGVSQGKLWQTEDGGLAWQAASTGAITPDLTAISVFRGNTAWVVGDQGTILKTADGGVSWASQRLQTTQRIQHVVAIDERTAWVASNTSTWRTLDGGQNWTLLNTFDQAASRSALAALSAELAWVSNGAVVRRTSDGGKQWLDAQIGPRALITSMSAGSERFIWAASDVGDKLYLSQDGGASWNLSTQLSDGSGIGQINRVVAVGEKSAWLIGLRRPANGGFEPVSWHTTDLGINWNHVLGSDASVFMEVAVFESQVKWVYAPEGIYELSANGAAEEWRSVTGLSASAPGLNAVDAIDGLNAWAVGYEGTVLKTSNGGKDWSVAASMSDHQPLVKISAVSSTTAWVLTQAGALLKTSDGKAWLQQANEADHTWFAVDALSPRLIWLGGTGSAIRRSVDGGAQWASQAVPLGVHVLSIKGVNELNAWALGVDSGQPERWLLLQTTDGAKWQQVTPPQTPANGWRSISLPAQNVIWLLGEQRGSPSGQAASLLLSDDGGASWKPRNGPVGGDLFEITASDAHNVWITSAAGLWHGTDEDTLCASTDGKLCWRLQSLGARRALSLSAAGSQTLWAVSDEGFIYKTITGGE